ncbi:MAG: hypothetical protein K6E13_09840, partial [Lachnospiraceae bacterium]|nr:hypothetical protein [Lachnospiraceae bacterium]
MKKIFDIPEQYAYPIAMIGFVFLYLALKGLEIMEIVGYPLSSYGFIVLIVALTKRIPKIVQFVLDSRIW